MERRVRSQVSGDTGMRFVGEWQDQNQENVSNIKGYSLSQVSPETQEVSGSRWALHKR